MGFFGRALFTVFVFGVVAAIGAGLYHAGYNQGIDATATGAAGTVVVTREHWGWAWAPLGFFGLLFPLFFLFMIFSFISRMIGWGRGGGWAGHGQTGPGGWGGHRWKSREEMLEDWHQHQHESPSAAPGGTPEQHS